MNAQTVYREQLKYQLEQSPFSEEIIVTFETHNPVCLAAVDKQETAIFESSGELRIMGIFDESVEREMNTSAIRKKPRVYVYRWLSPMPEGTRVVVRGKQYSATSYDKDANMGIVVWLR
jgi:hypothetical protein